MESYFSPLGELDRLIGTYPTKYQFSIGYYIGICALHVMEMRL